MNKLLGNPWALAASCVWGGFGLGFAVYGKKQESIRHLGGGIALVAISYFLADSALLMSVISIAIIIAIFWLKRYFP